MSNIIERTLEFFAFMLLIAAAVAVWFVVPAYADTTAMRGPSGANVYSTKCKSDPADCYAEAANYCQGSYQVLGSESHGGGIFADVINGPINYYTIQYRCGRSDGRLAAFPRTSPYYHPPRPFYLQCDAEYNSAACAGFR